MYLWKIDRLKDDLKNGNLTQKDEFLYALFWFLVYKIFIVMSYSNSLEISDNDYIDAAVDIIFTVVGTYYIYIKNGANNGKEFMKRYFSLSFVLGNRLMVLVLLFSLILGLVEAVAKDFFNIQNSAIDMLYGILFIPIGNIVYFYFLAKHITDVAANSN